MDTNGAYATVFYCSSLDTVSLYDEAAQSCTTQHWDTVL